MRQSGEKKKGEAPFSPRKQCLIRQVTELAIQSMPNIREKMGGITKCPPDRPVLDTFGAFSGLFAQKCVAPWKQGIRADATPLPASGWATISPKLASWSSTHHHSCLGINVKLGGHGAREKGESAELRHTRNVNKAARVRLQRHPFPPAPALRLCG